MAEPLSNADRHMIARVLLDQRPPQAFDPDGKPRVPASGGSDPYPFPVGAYPENPGFLQRVEDDPMGSVVWPAFSGAMNTLAATGDAMGPTGMPISMLARMGSAVAKYPGAALGKGPSAQFKVDRLREEMAPLRSAEATAGRSRPAPQPPPGSPINDVLESLTAEKAGLDLRSQSVRQELARRLSEFNARIDETVSPSVPLLERTPNLRMGYEAAKQGMERQYPPNFTIGQSVPYVRPEANPVRIDAAAREAEALRRGRIDMDIKASAERYANSPAEQAFRMDESAQRILGGVANQIGTPPDKMLVLRGEANLPGGNPNRGVYERDLSTLIDILTKERGASADTIIEQLAARGYAVPPRATFNANVMQEGRGTGMGSGSRPQTPAEKALRDAMHRRNAPAAGVGQGGSNYD